jgi:hypothetical protein
MVMNVQHAPVAIRSEYLYQPFYEVW